MKMKKGINRAGIVMWSITASIMFMLVLTGCSSTPTYIIPGTGEKLSRVVVIKPGTTVIKAKAYYLKFIEMVSIPHGVTEIGKEAFRANWLYRVHIPETVTTIAPDAFKNGYYDSRTGNFTDTIVIFMKDMPGEYIGKYKITPNETGITITNYIGIDKDVVIPSVIDSATVTEIGRFAFAGKGLTSVVIPDTVTVINEGAFEYNFLSTVDIPGGIQSLGICAFYRNTILSEVKLPDTLISIGDFAFQISKLENVTIPDSVQTIGLGAFYDKYLGNSKVQLLGNRNFIGGIITSGNDFKIWRVNNFRFYEGDYGYPLKRYDGTPNKLYLPPGDTTIHYSFNYKPTSNTTYSTPHLMQCQINVQPGAEYKFNITEIYDMKNIVFRDLIGLEITITGPEGVVFTDVFQIQPKHFGVN
jgi:hypothetical protein